MPTCDYCDDEFEDEAAYVDHLEAQHADELDRIDQRRVEGGIDDSGPGTAAYAAIAIAVLLVAGGGAYALLTGGGGGAELPEVQQQPSELNSVHKHGQISVTIGGEEIDFSQGEYQLNDDYFHFEGGDGDKYHVHAKGVTLQYALNTLDIGVTEDRVVYGDQVYERGEDDVTITVNGEPVDPATYVLQDGDTVVVEAG